MEKIDQFLEYLYTIDENTTELTTLQVQKLEVIKDKVAEIVKKVETCAAAFGQCSPEHQYATEPVQVKQLELVIQENKVHTFSEFNEMNEKIVKHGKEWQVKNKKGTKVLGTHSSRKAAVKQLQAIEISKAQNAR
jgi:hypothetical protein